LDPSAKTSKTPVENIKDVRIVIMKESSELKGKNWQQQMKWN
jgi:hypothetical protein